VLSADHGGANIPEEWASIGMDGVRVSPVTIQKALNEELEKKFALPGLVLSIEESDVYLDVKAIETKKLDPAVVRRFAAAFLQKQADLQTAIARDDVGTADPSGLGRSFGNSYHPERSGDVLMVLKPFHVLEFEKAGTSHGTPWSYDSEVPIMLLGKGVKPGVYGQVVRPIDLAPTVSAVLEMGAPASNEGHALSEALTLPKQ
jgi:hypothetical protein